jgi:hypothetical protein
VATQGSDVIFPTTYTHLHIGNVAGNLVGSVSLYVHTVCVPCAVATLRLDWNCCTLHVSVVFQVYRIYTATDQCGIVGADVIRGETGICAP